MIDTGKTKHLRLVRNDSEFTIDFKQIPENVRDSTGQIYIPTPGEKRLLLVLCNPEYVDLLAPELCELAKISKKSYYRFIHRKCFLELHQKIIIESCKVHIAPVMQTLAKLATKEDSKCHNDRKLFLEMIGAYTKKTESKSEITIKRTIEDFAKEIVEVNDYTEVDYSS